MPGPLTNARWERFAQEQAKGKTADQSYKLAGYKPNRHNAARLNTNETIQARVAEILARGAERAAISQEMVLREFGRIGFSDLRKAVSWGPTQHTVTEGEDGEPIVVSNGVTLRDSGEIDDDTAAAISEVSQTKDGAIRIKLHDKQAALVSIGRHLGMFIDRTEIGGPNGMPIPIDITDDAKILNPKQRAALRGALAGMAAKPATGNKGARRS